MMIEKKVPETIGRYQMLKNGDTVIVALSGCLLYTSKIHTGTDPVDLAVSSSRTGGDNVRGTLHPGLG